MTSRSINRLPDMIKLLVRLATITLAAAGFTFGGSTAPKPIYENDFQSVEIGKEPEGFLILAGAFAVRAENRNRFLELPGTPLEDFGALFGEATMTGSRVEASVQSWPRRRLSPTFGVGLYGLGGFRLLLSGNKGKLELWRRDEVVASANHRWQKEGWTRLILAAVPQQDGSWRIRGKSWDAGGEEPADWMIDYFTETAPPQGKPSIWGQPFSGFPIRFDDLTVRRVGILE